MKTRLPRERNGHAGAMFAPGERVGLWPTRIAASEETIGASQWVLEVADYRHSAGFVAAMRALGEASGGVNPFFQFESLSASMERMGVQKKWMMLLWERIGDASLLRLAFPFAEEWTGFPPRKVMRVWSHPYAPLSMPLVDLSDFDETVGRFASLLARLELRRPAMLVFENFPCGTAQGARLIDVLASSGITVAKSCTSHRAALYPRPGLDPNSWMAPLANKKRRHEFARQMRKLEALGTVRYQKSGDFKELAVRLEEFLLLEARGWKGSRRTSIHTVKRGAAYARQMVATFGAHGDAAIHSLRLNDRPIAALIVLSSSGRHYPWKTAFDESLRSLSPGAHLMLHATLDIAATPGFELADSLAGENSWMEGLWPDRMKLQTLVIGVNSAAGRQDSSRIARWLERKAQARRAIKSLLT